MTQLTCPVCGFPFPAQVDQRTGEITLWCDWCTRLMKRESA